MMFYPRMMLIRQSFETLKLMDVPGEIVKRMDGLGLADKIMPGQSVAVACSSRGITNYRIIVKTIVEKLMSLGLKPFLIPAMGSHGAADAEGQKSVLENYGLGESFISAPIKSSLEVARIGETEDGIPVFIDKYAYEADRIVLVNRVKSHTEFEHEIESGIMKMAAIGLGKETGARLYHKGIMTHGYPRIITSVARKVLETGKILCGVGIVENGLSETALIDVADGSNLEEIEKDLLKEAKRLAPRLPFEDVDVLIIDEMGKDISGTGFDTKVVGRIMMPLIALEPESPRIKRIVVCDLTKNTAGNADGVGLADFITQKLMNKIDMKALYVNALAGAEPEHAKIPMAMPSDLDAVKAAIDSVGLIPPDKLKIIRIKNTMQLGRVEVSEAYESELARRGDLEIIRHLDPPAFNDLGDLAPIAIE